MTAKDLLIFMIGWGPSFQNYYSDTAKRSLALLAGVPKVTGMRLDGTALVISCDTEQDSTKVAALLGTMYSDVTELKNRSFQWRDGEPIHEVRANITTST